MNDLRMSFTTSEETREQLQKIANKKDMSMSAIIREALREYIQKENK